MCVTYVSVQSIDLNLHKETPFYPTLYFSICMFSLSKHYCFCAQKHFTPDKWKLLLHEVNNLFNSDTKKLSMLSRILVVCLKQGNIFVCRIDFHFMPICFLKKRKPFYSFRSIKKLKLTEYNIQ